MKRPASRPAFLFSTMFVSLTRLNGEGAPLPENPLPIHGPAAR